MAVVVTAATCRLGDLVGTPQAAFLKITPVAPDSLMDSAALGSKARRANTIAVENDGGGELDWTASSKSGSAWLSLVPVSGRAPFPLQVVSDPDGLGIGIYYDTVVVQSTSGGALEAPVRFRVYPCRPTSLQVNDARTDTLNAADCGAPHRSGSQAQVFSFTGQAGDSASIELTAGFDGHLVFDTTLTPTVPPLGEADGCLGDGNADPCLYYVRLPRTGTYYIEVTSASAADSGLFNLRLLHPGRLPDAPDSLDQRLLDSTTSVPSGATIGTSSLLLRAVVSDSDRVDSLYLEAEVQPVGTAFTNSPTGPPGLKVGNGQPAWVSVSGLADNTEYHWQVRTKDWTGRPGPWVAFPNPAFNVQLGADPNPPTSLLQFQSDGSTPIPLGQTANGTTVVFKAQVSDPDAGNTLQLQVEVQPIGTNFTDNPDGSSPPVASGATAVVPIAGLSGGTSYHWQARTVDNTSRQSGWVSFPTPVPNPEGDADFQVQIPPQQLVFTVQPAVDTSGRPIRPAVQVEVQDQNGNRITSFTGQVTMAIANNPAGGTLTGMTAVNAIAGVATFSNLIIDKAGTGYTLQASTGTISSLPSNAFNVVAGPATQLAFTGQPSHTPATSPITPPVLVTARDAAGNTATSFTGNVTVAITPGTGTPGATLGGTTTRPATAGTATFSDLTIDRLGNGYTLRATSGTLAAATSVPFNITPLGGPRLVFTTQPGNTGAGAPINGGTGGVVVTAQDAAGNTITTFTGTVTMAITAGTGTAGATLFGTTTAVASAGVATFPNLRIDRVGTGYTLTATEPSAASGTSTTFNITAGPTRQLVFTVQPGTTTAGVAITPAVQVAARDTFGNPTPNFTGPVTITIANDPTGGAATLTGGGPINAIGGVAQFPNLRINRTGNGYTLRAASGTLVADTSVAFNITSAPPVSLVFTTQPTTTTAGVAINSGSGGVVVTARDSLGNTATSFTSTVTMILGANPAGGVLSGTLTATPIAGVATFPNLRIIKAGAGYQLQASGGALTSPLSNAFTIAVGPVNRLAFIVQPTTTADSAPITPAVQVAGQDSVGNAVTSFTGLVRMFIGQPGSNPGGGTLSGTTQVNAVAGTGVATFSNLRINAPGTGYTLLTTSTGLFDDESVPFAIIAGPAAALFFTGQPSQTVAGSPISPTVEVTARDNQGNTATSFFGNITLTIGNNPPGNGILTGGSATANAGVASFPAASIDKAGTPYTLVAGATGLTGATSVGFTIIAGGVNAALSSVTASPASFTACSTPCSTGAGTATLVTVTARDNSNNVIAGATASIVVSGTGNTITPTGAQTTNGLGQATWTVNSTVAESKTITGTAGGVQINQQPAVTVNPAAPKVLLYNVQPNTTVATQTIRPATGVQVEVRDTFNNRVTGANISVNIAILNNPPNPPGTLSGTTTATQGNGRLVGGIATFNDLSIDKVGTGYTLLTSSTGLVSDTSSAFNITVGAATKLGFVQQPTSTAGGATITPAVTVEVQDAGGNRVNSNAIVTLAIGTNPGGGSLSGDSVNNAMSGLATFGTLSINNAGTGYTLQATATGLTPVTSSAFNITVGGAARLGFVQQPTAANGGATIAPAVTVEIQDAGGNRVLGATNSVTLAIGVNPGPGAVLSGTNPVSAVNGLATFSNLSIDSAGTGYTLVATSGSLTQATSNAFNITVGAAAKLGFVQQPTSTGGGATISPAITVAIQDLGGNRVAGATNNVTLAIGANPGPNGVLSGTNPVSAVNGLASFSTLSIDSAGTGYTLVATSGSLTQATSNAFNITVGPAVELAFRQQPTQTDGGAMISPAVTVEIRDLGGNRVNSSASVTVDFGNNPGGAGTLSGTTMVNASAGLATFSTLSIDRAANGYTLSATSGSLTGATSNSFNIVVGPPAKLAFLQQPTSATAGVTISPAITVRILDAGNNLVTNATNTVDIAILNNAGGGTLSGDASNPAVGGVAPFNGLSIDLAGSGYTLRATATGLTGVTSNGFDITAGAVSASNSTIAADPTTITACAVSCSVGGGTASLITVTARDAFGNLIQGATVVLSSTSPDASFTQPGSTDGSGVATGTMSASLPGDKVVSAEIDGTPVTQTVTITVN